MLISARQYGKARIVKQIEYFFDAVEDRLTYDRLRWFNINEATSPAIQFFTNILTTITDESVLHRDMLDVYLDDILPSVASTSRIFDALHGGNGSASNILIAGSTKEFYLPTSGLVGAQVNALDPWSEWENVNPVRLVACDSDELVTTWQSELRYRHDEPRYMVVCIDTAALLCKYVVYLRHYGKKLTNMDIHKFINNQIIFPMKEDWVEVWALNKFKKISMGEEPGKLLCADVVPSGAYNSAMAQMAELYKDHVRGKFDMGSLFNTPIIYKRTIADCIQIFENLHSLPSMVQYRGYGLMKMETITAIATNALLQTRNRGLETTAINRLLKDARVINNSNWKSHMKDDLMVTQIDTLLNLIEMLDDPE